MKAINQRRKDLVAQWLAAVEEAAAVQEEAPILLVRCQGIPEGIVGIVAGKLSEAHQRPAFVFSDIASAPGLLRDLAGPMGTLTSPPDPCGHALRGKCRRATPGQPASPSLRGSTAPWGRPSPSGPRTTAPSRR